MERPRRWMKTLLAYIALAVAGCSSHFEPPELQGRPAMVADAGQPRLWVLSKQEEARQVGYGGSRRSGGWRTDTFFHFQVQAFDPVSARPLWSRRVLTLGDDEARGSRSRVIGSASDGRLLGQDGDLVWLLVDDKPLALAVADGVQVADTAAIERANPRLGGLLPVEGKHYGFDRGLVFMAADARSFVVRGRALQAEPYVPPPQAQPPVEYKANGMPVIVPLRPPIGEVPARQVWLDGKWLGLYSPKEAEDAGNDAWGGKLRWPYSVHDEGALARRGFWRAEIIEVRRFDERYKRLDALKPIPDAPVFLKGRFFKDLATGEPLVLESPAGVMVWHSTRIDREGRLALARLDANLRSVWRAELPLSENTMVNPVMYWMLPGRVVVLGGQESQVDGVSRRAPHLASVSVADGSVRAWDLQGDKPLP